MGSPERNERYFPQFFQEGPKLDLSGQGLSRVPKHTVPALLPKITQLLLNNNQIVRLDNVQQFSSVIELSASHNRLYRMYQIAGLKHLVRLDLSHNVIISIEGLKDLVHLTYLNLSYNKIKLIDQIQTNILLEHINLSHNLVTAVTNISQLPNLKKLELHNNAITSLKHCELYLPRSLECLTLASNRIDDLNEISYLQKLNLTELTIHSNPCVSMTGGDPGFDYRPFLINWCSVLKSIDSYEVDDIESLKGEWLYSHGRGRQFRPGQHAALVQYLVDSCPLNSQNLQTEQERKLKLILTKAQEHRDQLQQSENPMSASTSKMHHKSPFFQGLMTQSLDPSLLDSCSTQISGTGPVARPVHRDHALTRSLICDASTVRDEEPLAAYSTATAPLPAASKLVPVPESLISPMVTNTPPLVIHPTPGSSIDPPSASKLQTIKSAAEKKKVKRGHGTDREQAAICIQKMWRGYHTRNLNPKVLNIYHHLQTKRTNQYIQKLTIEMEATRMALDSEHKLQILQMQAINALWKKVVSLQPADTMVEVKDLAQTCDRLNAQVQQLQSCMQEVLRCVSPSSSSAMATQTDIVAVHTPSHDAADSRLFHSRPSTLPILPQQVSQYADHLVVGVINDTVKDQPPKDNSPTGDRSEGDSLRTPKE